MSRKKGTKPLPLLDKEEQQPDLATALAENSTFLWIIGKAKVIGVSFALLVVAILSTFFFSNERLSKKQADYLLAQNAFEKITKAAGSEEWAQDTQTSQLQLLKILKTRPELKAKYEGILAQIYLVEKNTDYGLDFAEETIQRTDVNRLSFYEEYAKTSLLIAEGKVQDALARAQTLKDQLLKEKQSREPTSDIRFGNLLFANNLFRIATLQQELGLKDEERNTWAEWEKYEENPKSDVIDYKILKSFATSISLGDATLVEFITARKKALN